MAMAPLDPFDVVANGAAVDIYVDAQDYPAVVRAVADVRSDVERVSGKLPAVKNSVEALSTQAILIGTLGKSPVIDALVTEGKLDVSEAAGLGASIEEEKLSPNCGLKPSINKICAWPARVREPTTLRAS